MAGLLEIIMCINVLSEAGLGWARHTEQPSYQHQPGPGLCSASPGQFNSAHQHSSHRINLHNIGGGPDVYHLERKMYFMSLSKSLVTRTQELPSNQAGRVTVNNRNNILKPGLLKSAGSVCKLLVI